MIRHKNSLSMLAVVALMNGCGGEGSATGDVIPGAELKLNQLQSGALTTIKHQEIANLGYSTYLGFAGDEYGNAIAVDGAGNSYVTGTTTSFGGITNIFIAKMSPSGSNLYYTYLPGTEAKGIAVDSSGNAYVVGRTANGPTILKLNATGNALIYSATLGWNELTGVRVDSSGNAYVVGSVNNGVAGVDVAVGKVEPAGTYFVYALAFGGTQTDRGAGIAIDRSGNAYVVGTTNSTNYPVASASQTTLRGPEDAFITKLNATGTGILFSTYLGGTWYDAGAAIALDGSNNVYVTGHTVANNGVLNFPVTSGTIQMSPGGGLTDAFAAKFSSTGARVWATYVGGGGADYGTSIAASSTGVPYVTGYTNSVDFRTTNLAYQRFAPPGTNAFVAQLSTTANAYSYSTYLGGNSTDVGSSIGLDSSNNVYLSGNTNSADFPTHVYAPGGMYDAFVTKFNGP
jgi:hypothetical protein